MISDALQKWTVAIVIFLGAVNPQMPMMQMGFGYGGPMMMPPPPPPPMMPIPIPVGIPIPYPESTSTTTTTTTTESNNENSDNRIPIGIPIPVPHFVQIAIPGFLSANCFPGDKNNGNGNGGRNKKCPPCPPCSCNPCTPSFFSFCSPCHLECRCKNGKANPSPREPIPPKPFPGPAFPMPIPMPAPGPVVIVPFPGHFGSQPPWKKPPRDSDCESSSASDSCEDSKSDDSCDSSKNLRNKKHRKGKGKGRNRNRNRKRKSKYDIQRRNFGHMRNRSDKRDGLVEPVLTYMSRNGDIKLERRLSNDEAHALLGGREPFGDMEPLNRARDTNAYSNVHLTAGEDLNNKPKVLVRSEPGLRIGRRRRQEFFVGRSEYVLGEGKKELMFKTPDNKKISNLSVSFQITK